MLWTRIKMIVAVVLVIGLAGSGAGWLTRGRGGAEAAPPAAEPPKQAARGSAEPERHRQLQVRREQLHKELEKLNDAAADAEDRWGEEMIAARLRLMEQKEELHAAERQQVFERERRRVRLKQLEDRRARLEDALGELSQKTTGKEPPPTLLALDKQLSQVQNEADRMAHVVADLERNDFQALRPLRERALRVEDALRRLQQRQAWQREELTAKRQALLDRLRQLEDGSPDAEPADRRLREVERKLDLLRREVAEVRRSLERRPDPEKKR